MAETPELRRPNEPVSPAAKRPDEEIAPEEAEAVPEGAAADYLDQSSHEDDQPGKSVEQHESRDEEDAEDGESPSDQPSAAEGGVLRSDQGYGGQVSS